MNDILDFSKLEANQVFSFSFSSFEKKLIFSSLLMKILFSFFFFFDSQTRICTTEAKVERVVNATISTVQNKAAQKNVTIVSDIDEQSN